MAGGVFVLRGELVLGVHGICLTEHTVTCFLSTLQLPLVDEVAKRILEFSRKCLSSNSTPVSCVVYHGL